MAAGRILLQWQATGCHIALLFGPDGRFIKITHEFANYAPAPSGCMLTVAMMLILLATIATAIAFH
jgi:hypothetical protein